MYTHYFGLTEAPFAISPNPRYLYMSEAHREALAHLLYGLKSDGCIILLTGDVGTGKTTLCRCLLDQLPDNTEVAVVLNPRLTAREMLKTICEEFGLLPEHGMSSIKTYIDALNAHLLRAHANDQNIAIIIDEAQNLAIDVLEQLRLLTNLETPTRKLLRIILLGQPEFRDMLERPELSQINQRITSRYHLGPLEPNDVEAYIDHRLKVAGDHGTPLFAEKAIRHAIKLTGGVPRLINVLCDRALLGAYALNQDHVDLSIMRQAGEEIFPNSAAKDNRRKKVIIWVAAGAFLLLTPSLIFIPDLFTSKEQVIEEPVEKIKSVTDSAEPSIVPQPTSAPPEQLETQADQIEQSAQQVEAIHAEVKETIDQHSSTEVEETLDTPPSTLAADNHHVNEIVPEQPGKITTDVAIQPSGEKEGDRQSVPLPLAPMINETETEGLAQDIPDSVEKVEGQEQQTSITISEPLVQEKELDTTPQEQIQKILKKEVPDQ